MKGNGKAFKATVLAALFIGLIWGAGNKDAYAANHDNHDGWNAIKAEDLESDDYLLDSGNYYLDEDIVTEHALKIGDSAHSVDVTLCLNGHSLSSSGYRVIWLDSNSTLVIDDCSPAKTGNLVITSTGHSVLEVNNRYITGQELNLTINAGTFKSSGDESEAYIIYAYCGRRDTDQAELHFKMNGGSVIAPNQRGINAEWADEVVVNNADITAKEKALYASRAENIEISECEISVSGDYAIEASTCSFLSIDQSTVKAQGEYAVYCSPDGSGDVGISSSQISSMDKAVYIYSTADTPVYIARSTITAVYDAIQAIDSSLRIAGSRIESKSGYETGKELKPGYPINCENGRVWVEGDVTLVARENYPQIFLENARMGLPETLPEKPFIFLLKQGGLGTSFMNEPEVPLYAEAFKDRFPNNSISDYLTNAVGAYFLEEVDGNYYVAYRNIDKQPTQDSPTMKSNEEGRAKYQWYDVSPTASISLTDENTTYYTQGLYNPSANEWNLKSNQPALAFVNEHDYAELVIKVKRLQTSSSSLRGVPNIYNYLMLMAEENGVRSIPMGTLNLSEPGIYTVQIPYKGLVAIVSRHKDDVIAELSVNYYDINYPIEGQVTNTLTCSHYGYASCKAVYAGETLEKQEDTQKYIPRDISGVLLSSPVYLNGYSVNFETNGGSYIAPLKVLPGSLVTKPSNPSFKGLTFAGWYKDAALKSAWNFKSDKVNSNITLYAKWKVSDEQFEEYTSHILDNFRVRYLKDSVKFTWGREKEADEYGVFLQYCGPSFTKKPTAIVKAGTKKTLTKSLKKVGTKKLPKAPIKGYVVAYKYAGNQKIIIAQTPAGHSVQSSYKKRTNPKTIKVNKSSITLNKGKKFSIVTSVTKQDNSKKFLSKDHCEALRYVSSNSKIVKVSSNGVITAKKKGTAYVYVLTIDGMNKKIKVKVK